MTVTSFQRARKPDEIAARRQAILAAAAALFDAEGPKGAGLNAIAAKAGFTKSNVYRYFESREAVLLSLFLDDFEALVQALETGLAACPQGDVAAVAAECTAQFLSRPRLCRLISILSSVLEENVSEAGILALKRRMLELTGRIAGALHRAMPAMPLADCAWSSSLIGALVAGMWPIANPGPVAARVLAMEEFSMLKPKPERDLERAILVIIKGVAGQ